MPIYSTKEKKDGKTKYRVVVSYTAPDGSYKKKERTAYGLPDAKALEALLTKELAEAPPAARITVNDLFQEYLASKKGEIRETSWSKIERVIRQDVIPFLGTKTIDKLDKRTLQEWKNRIAEKDSALTTKQNIYKELRGMLNFAVRMDYIPKNNLTALGNFRDSSLEIHTEPLRYYTAEQFKEYITAAKDKSETITDWGFYVFFCIAFYTGARKGEINALKWSDIEGDVMHIRRSIAQKLKGGDRETAPKNKSSIRDIKLPLPLIEILENHRQRHMLSPDFTEDFRVCGGIAPLRDTTIDHKNRTFAKAADLPHIRVHDFRHTHATLLINEGINIQEIARRLGHSDVQITWNTYSHLYPREEERALSVLNKVL
jgi:integrase